MSGRGGARHKAKFHADTDLLYKILADHKDLLRDVGSPKPKSNILRVSAPLNHVTVAYFNLL